MATPSDSQEMRLREVETSIEFRNMKESFDDFKVEQHETRKSIDKLTAALVGDSTTIGLRERCRGVEKDMAALKIESKSDYDSLEAQFNSFKTLITKTAIGAVGSVAMLLLAWGLKVLLAAASVSQVPAFPG